MVMKYLNRLLFFSIYYIVCVQLFVSSEVSAKDCEYHFSHELHGDSLYLSCYISADPYMQCNPNDILTVVDLGNGDHIQWYGSSDQSYIYPCTGDFDVKVTANSNGDDAIQLSTGLEFAVHIDRIICSAPSFEYKLFYYSANQYFKICCNRVDSCSINRFYWTCGDEPSNWSDSSVFTLPLENEGKTISVCLNFEGNCSIPVCKQFLLTRENAVLITSPLIAVEAIFPNPVGDYIHISIPEINGPALAYIYDLNGRVIWQQQLNASSESNDFVINIENYPPGVYFIRVIAEAHSVFTEKVVKI